MKKIVLSALLALGLTTTAHAETGYATVTSVTPNYQTVYVQVPSLECQDVHVPVYRQGHNNSAGGGALAGMIIGGLIGKGLTDEDQAAAVGAVIGGIIGADRASRHNDVYGYRTERQCFDTYVNEPQQRIVNYRITFNWKGVTGSTYTQTRYVVGQQIPINVSLDVY